MSRISVLGINKSVWGTLSQNNRAHNFESVLREHSIIRGLPKGQIFARLVGTKLGGKNDAIRKLYLRC